MDLLEFIKENSKWIFSGIGVFLIGIILSIFKKKSSKPKLNIITKGQNSPGIVKGDYTIITNNKNEQKHKDRDIRCK